MVPPARARAVAFYLPQFHPIPENDDWWGKGFTEWTNVTRARPLFRDHAQPDLPGELGFYDLRLDESRVAQAELASAHGIEAFCYWHYWFAGRRLLARPFDEVLASGRPDFPFCLAWANQSWTGTWHAAPDRVLVEQTYPGPDDDRAHFDAVLPAFRDNRYLRVGGCPVFYVFRPEQLPDPRGFTHRWREFADAAGLAGLYLVAEVSDLLGRGPLVSDPGALGFDAGVYVRIPADMSASAVARMRLRRKIRRGPEVYPYAAEPIEPSAVVKGRVLPCVYPNWDNTPRSGRGGLALTGASPERFRAHLRRAVERVSSVPAAERFVFVKSWNEWAEGNHVEPCARFGRGYLDALGDELGVTA